jgi:hypothetical protein
MEVWYDYGVVRPKNYEQETTKFSSFGMNFDATRFIPKAFEKKNVMT